MAAIALELAGVNRRTADTEQQKTRNQPEDAQRRRRGTGEHQAQRDRDETRDDEATDAHRVGEATGRDRQQRGAHAGDGDDQPGGRSGHPDPGFEVRHERHHRREDRELDREQGDQAPGESAVAQVGDRQQGVGMTQLGPYEPGEHDEAHE
ncbi:MAG TPA: hypothetical protein VIE19_07205, partial [Lapillicoccus sp.]